MAQPVIRAGAPHSSTLIWAVSAHRMLLNGRVTACRATEFAPVPLNTKKGEASLPNTSCILLVAASVQGSSPYPTA